nr:MAG TPA: hypothetical protein [Caudoviricetes sp.]
MAAGLADCLLVRVDAGLTLTLALTDEQPQAACAQDQARSANAPQTTRSLGAGGGSILYHLDNYLITTTVRTYHNNASLLLLQ